MPAGSDTKLGGMLELAVSGKSMPGSGDSWCCQTTDMRREARGLWPVVVVAAVVGGTLWLVYAVWRSPHRNDLATFGSYVAAVAVVAVALITRAWEVRTRQSGDALQATELDELSDLFARAVKDQWTRAAADRGLLQPDPIPA